MLPARFRSRKLLIALIGVLTAAGGGFAFWGCKTLPDHVDLHIHNRPDVILMPQSPDLQPKG